MRYNVRPGFPSAFPSGRILSSFRLIILTFQILTFFWFYGIYNYIVKKMGVETMNHQDILKLQEKIKSISDLKAKIETMR